jgi:hypothetical protein
VGSPEAVVKRKWDLTFKFSFIFKISWAWWHTPIIPALGKVRQEDSEFKASLGYTDILAH